MSMKKASPIFLANSPPISHKDKIAWINGKTVILFDNEFNNVEIQKIINGDSEAKIIITSAYENLQEDSSALSAPATPPPPATVMQPIAPSVVGEPKVTAAKKMVELPPAQLPSTTKKTMVIPPVKLPPPVPVPVITPKKHRVATPPQKAKTAKQYIAPAAKPIPPVDVIEEEWEEFVENGEVFEEPVMYDEKENIFQSAIKKFGWKNKSDGDVDITRIRLGNAEKKVFAELFDTRVEIVRAVISDNAQFKIMDQNDVESLLYHIILLGNVWFENLMSSPDLVDFIIISKEYQKITRDQIDKIMKA